GRNPFEMIKGEWYTEKDPGYVVTDNYYAPNQITVTVDTSGLNTNVGGRYYVYYKATDPSGNVSDDNTFRQVIVNFATGIRDIMNNDKLSVYPNPSSDGLVNIESKQPITSLKVVDISGKQVLNQTIDHKTTLQLSLARSGVYLIEIVRENDFIIKRILIN
ncbi:MAG: T9SS type A sorting domain-containing protein, partial [Bacteroidota bacterium]